MVIHTQELLDGVMYTIEAGFDHAIGFFINIYDTVAKESSDPGGIDNPWAWDQKLGYWQKSVPERIDSMILGFRTQTEQPQ